MPASRKDTPRTSKATRRARGSLSGEEIIEAAYALVEESGLDALSMPILARRLGAGVTSIYWYFRNKDDLVVALAERVSEEFYAAVPDITDGPWGEELERHFVAMREVLLQLPVYLDLFSVRPRFVSSRPTVFPRIAAHLERAIGRIVELGFSPVEAAHRYIACSAYTRGFVVLELGLRKEDAELDPAIHAQLVEAVGRLDPNEYSTLTTLDDFEHAVTPHPEQFVIGLRLLLAGIQIDAQRRTASSTPGRRRTKRP